MPGSRKLIKPRIEMSPLDLLRHLRYSGWTACESPYFSLLSGHIDESEAMRLAIVNIVSDWESVWIALKEIDIEAAEKLALRMGEHPPSYGKPLRVIQPGGTVSTNISSICS